MVSSELFVIPKSVSVKCLQTALARLALTRTLEILQAPVETLPAVADCIAECFAEGGGSGSEDELFESAFATLSKLVLQGRGFLTSVT